MRTTFAILFSFLTVVSLVWWRFQPTPPAGVTQLVWVSDLNPLRGEQTALFEKLHPSVHVDVDPAGGTDKVIVQSLGGIGPDMFDSFDPLELSAYVQSGIALDITDELKARGIDISKRVYPGILKGCVLNGRVYGVPTNAAADGLWFHREILAAAGIPEHHGPWTWADFIPIAQKLTVRDNQGHPVRYGFAFEWWQWRSFFAGFDAHVYTQDGTRCIIDSPQAVAAVTLMHDLVYKYRVSSSPEEEASMATAGGFGSGGLSVFGARQAATALGGRWWLAQLRTYKGLDLGVCEAPYGTVRHFYSNDRACVINKGTKHLQAALDFLVYLTQAPYNKLLNHQADGLSAFPEFNAGEEYLHDPDYPAERDNATWRDILAVSVGAEASEFVSGQKVNDIITAQLDLVKSDQKTPEAALRTIQDQVNEQIDRNVRESPSLARRYREVRGQP